MNECAAAWDIHSRYLEVLLEELILRVVVVTVTLMTFFEVGFRVMRMAMLFHIVGVVFCFENCGIRFSYLSRENHIKGVFN